MFAPITNKAPYALCHTLHLQKHVTRSLALLTTRYLYSAKKAKHHVYIRGTLERPRIYELNRKAYLDKSYSYIFRTTAQNRKRKPRFQYRPKQSYSYDANRFFVCIQWHPKNSDMNSCFFLGCSAYLYADTYALKIASCFKAISARDPELTAN